MTDRDHRGLALIQLLLADDSAGCLVGIGSRLSRELERYAREGSRE